MSKGQIYKTLRTNGKIQSHEEAASMLGYLTFSFLTPIFQVGSRRSIENYDLGVVGAKDIASSVGTRFNKAWNAELFLPEEHRSLWRIIWGTIGIWNLIWAIFLYFLSAVLSFGPVIILNLMVRHFSDEIHISQTNLYLLAGM
jgi:hypothetical protein